MCIRFPIKDVPSLIWTLNEKDVDYQDLSRDQLVNHFEGITNCLTTKRGYCELLKDLHLHSVDCNDIAPRCYNLGDPIHRDEFIDEFRLVACLNILKWYVLHSLEQQQLSGQQQQQQNHNINNNNNNNSSIKLNNNSNMRDQLPQHSNVPITDDDRSHSTRTKYCIVSPPHDTNSSCCTCCLHPTAAQSSNSSICSTSISMMRIVLVARRVSLWYLRVRLYGEWPGVDGSEIFRDQDTAPLDEKSWCEVLDASYDVVEASYQYRLEDVWELMMRCRGSAYAFNPLLTQLQAILWRYHQLTPQFACVDGFRNIWVVKAPDSSCGIGIKVLYRLDDILQSERGMGSRTVQKYVEYPLLAPLYVHTSGSTNNNSSTTTTASTIASTTASTTATAASSSGGGVNGSSTNSNCNPSRSYNKILTKFDMRVWVLVTCFKSFRCFVYSTLYGRRCSNAYTSDVSSLGETFTHLTNYSIQKKQSFEVHQTIATNATASSSSSSSSDSKTCIVNRDGDAIASSSTSSSARKLRQACSTSRPNSNSSSSSSTHSNSSSSRSSSSSCHKVTYELSESDLLIDHDDIIRIVHSAYQQYLQQLSCSSLSGAGTASLSDKQLLAREVVRRIGVVEDVWRDYVWPAIKRKIAITLRGAREKVVHRPQCFEFLGYDVLIDEMLEPWILEVNMSPAMAHRTPNQCQLISHMSKGLVSLAISPWIHRNSCNPTTVEPINEACHDNDSSSSDSSVGGAWEQLIYQLDPPDPTSDSHHPPTTTVEQSLTDDWADCIPVSPPSSEGLLHHQDCSDSITTTSESSREHPATRHMNNLDNSSNSRHHSSGSSSGSSGSGYFSKFSAIASLRKGSRAVVTVDASTALTIIGSSISWSTIACFDYCCIGLDKIRRLQRCLTYHHVMIYL